MIRTRTNRGIAKRSNGYIVAEVEYGCDDEMSPERIIRRTLLSEHKGTGAKRAAIQAAGTNREVPA